MRRPWLGTPKIFSLVSQPTITKDQALKVAVVALASLYPEDAERVFGLEGLETFTKETEPLGQDVDVFNLLKAGIEAPKS